MMLDWLFGLNSLWCRVWKAVTGNTKGCFKRTPPEVSEALTDTEIPPAREVPPSPDKHKDKPYKEVPVYPEPSKRVQIDGMGIFCGWFMPYWWEGGDTRKWIIEQAELLFARYRETGVNVINFFLWLYDEHPSNAYMAHITPWERDDNGVFDLSKRDNKWYDGLNCFLELMRIGGIEPLPCHFMARYGFLPFSKNRNGVSGFYDPRATPFQNKLINDVTLLQATRWQSPKARMMNEPNHAGQDDKLHLIADKHRDWYLQTHLKRYVALEDLFFDSSTSEGVYAHFVGSKCPKCGYQFGYIGGNTRRIQVVNHGYSIPQNLAEKGFSRFLGSNWNPPSGYWLGGDAGAGDLKHLAEGHALYMPYGAGWKMIWRQGSPEQTYQMCKKAFQAAKEAKKNTGVQITHFETLQGEERRWPLKEDFRKNKILWARVKAAVDAEKEVYGGK
jgi:hypothetical protein